MKVRAKNIAIDPVYWHYGVKWPIGMVMEYDLADGDYAAIKADQRFEIETAAVPAPAEVDESDKRGPGRPKKVK